MNEDRQRQIGAALGHAIAARREKAGLTQEQVSEMLGIGNQAISRIERGAVAPTVFRLYEFAGVFDCRVEDLLRESSDRTTDHASHLMQTLEGLTAEDQRALVSALGLLADQFRKNATTKRASR